MRFLADENFPGLAVAPLTEAGHDVRWVRTDDPGASDRDVMANAARDERVILTFDKDFGELVFRLGGALAPGVVLFRLSATGPEEIVLRILRILASRTDWQGMFSVADSNKLRMRPMSMGERNR